MFRPPLISLLGVLALAILPSLGSAQGIKVIAPVGGENEPVADEPQLIKLSFDPAPEPRPALKYELLPGYSEKTPGNSAQFYYRALLMASQLPKEHNKKYNEDHQKWTEAPFAEMPKEDMQAWVDGYRPTLGQLKLAVYRENCDWDLRIHEFKGMEVISFLLHDFQEMRHLARVLQVKARLEIAAGKYDEARETLRMGYKLAQDAAGPPTLINSLIGIAIASIMNQEVLELIASPDSPNMYWALAGLPDPLIDMRTAMRQEMQIPLQMFPFLKDAETAERTPEEWRSVILLALTQLSQLDGNVTVSRNPEWALQLTVTALLMKYYPEAKRALIEGGMSREKVEAMPVGQVVAIQASRAYFYAYHEMFKWSLIPYPEAWRRVEDAEQRLIREGYLGPLSVSAAQVLPIASLLLPAIKAVFGATARLEAQIAGLQTIEAIRMHAAANDRKLPRTLEAITVVPVPNNPATGKPFAYRLDGNKATLDVPAPDSQPRRNGKRYEITIAPPRDKK
jgi:hypothetical protein